LLFARELIVVNLGSGSVGNCTYVGDGTYGLLIDCGVSTKQVFARLQQALGPDAPIDAVFLTHEHSDHIAAAAILDRRLEKRQGRRIPFFSTGGTGRRIRSKYLPRSLRLIEGGRPARVGGLTVSAFEVPHDALEPVGFRVEVQGVVTVVLTDLGHAPESVATELQDATVALVEFNHDDQLLLTGPYSWSLKQRVGGLEGHLSNAQAEGLIVRGASDKLRHLILGHLSQENNTPALALAAAKRALRARSDLSDVEIQVAQPYEPTVVRVPLWDASGLEAQTLPTP